MSQDEQLQAMRDLVNKVSTPVSRAYGVFTNNTKLAFWYTLAELMEAGVVIPVPPSYGLSEEANKTLSTIQSLDFTHIWAILSMNNCYFSEVKPTS